MILDTDTKRPSARGLAFPAVGCAALAMLLGAARPDACVTPVDTASPHVDLSAALAPSGSAQSNQSGCQSDWVGLSDGKRDRITITQKILGRGYVHVVRKRFGDQRIEAKRPSSVRTAPAARPTPQSTFELPALHQIKMVTLSPPYSCRSREEFARGYAQSALFLSDFARQRNAPDLLFNGACGAADEFEAATAGDDMSLIADLGDGIALDELSASDAFNTRRVHAYPAYSKFARVAKIEQGHTYAVLLNASNKRGLFVLSVTEHVPNAKVTLRYAVKSYQVTPGGQISSPGFEWGRASGR